LRRVTRGELVCVADKLTHRLRLIRKVSRELELDMAKMADNVEPYGRLSVINLV
jgi:hypothetical protein